MNSQTAKPKNNRFIVVLLTVLAIIINCSFANEVSKSQTSEGWREWTSWTSCSLSCSNGIKTRTRTCLHQTLPHIKSRGRNHCIGKPTEHKMCNNKPCPTNSLDLKSFRCKQYNGRRVHGVQIDNWKPNYNVTNQCVLSCTGQLENSKPVEYNFGKLDDGTLCPETDNQINVCLNGRCTSVGCDAIVNSDVSEDKCGVCGGKSDTCKKIRYMNTSNIDWSINETSRVIAKIAKGSRYIVIKDGTRNYIAISDSKQKPIINSPQRLDSSNKYNAVGTTFYYTRNAGDGHEVIRSNGPINETVYLMMIKRENISKIYYEYWGPNKSEKSNTQTTSKRHDAFNEGKPKQIEKQTTHKKNKSSGKCPPCEQSKNLKKHFCKNEFVLRVVVTGSNVIRGQTRYELEVIQSFKNTVHLQSREFLWIPLFCKCPKMALHREYVIMGLTDKNLIKREFRLVVDGNSYIRRFSHSRARQLYRLKKDRANICNDEKIKNKTR